LAEATVAGPGGHPQAADGAGLGARFWRLFVSSATSNLADGAGRVVLPLLAAAISRDPVAVSAAVALGRIPWLLFALPGGAIVDRFDRRRSMALANGVRAGLCLCLGLAALTDLLSLPLLYAVIFCLALGEIVYDSAARAVLPMVVDHRRLDRANGWLTVEENVGQLAGAPLAAVLFGVAVALPLLGNGVWFALAAVMVMRIGGGYRPVREKKTKLRQDVADGLLWLWRDKLLRDLAIATCLIATFAAMASGILVLYALDVLGIPEAAFGLLAAGGGVGGLIGGLSSARIVSWLGRVRAFVVSAAIAPTTLVLMGLTTDPWVAGSLFACGAAGITVWNVLSMSLRQVAIPEALMGRTQAAYRMILWGGIPVGVLAGGALAASTSIATVFVLAGCAQFPVLVWLAVLLHRHRRRIADAYEEAV
jgi:MFS family permease